MTPFSSSWRGVWKQKTMMFLPLPLEITNKFYQDQMLQLPLQITASITSSATRESQECVKAGTSGAQCVTRFRGLVGGQYSFGECKFEILTVYFPTHMAAVLQVEI